jgi:hypothetical protein
MSFKHEYVLNTSPLATATQTMHARFTGFRLSTIDRIIALEVEFDTLPDVVMTCRAIIDHPTEHVQQVLGCRPDDEIVTVQFRYPPENSNFNLAIHAVFEVLMRDYRDVLDNWEMGPVEPADTLLRRLTRPEECKTPLPTTTHFFYFLTEASAMCVAQVLLDEYGFEDVSVPEYCYDAELTHRWLVTVTTTMESPVPQSLMKVLVDLGRRHGGQYDFYEHTFHTPGAPPGIRRDG